MEDKTSLSQQWAHLEAKAKSLLLRRGVSTTVLAGHTTKMVALAEEAEGMDDEYGEKLVALSRRILPTHPDVAVTALAAVVYYCPAGFSEANALAQDLIEDHRPLFRNNPEAMRRIGMNESDILKAHRELAAARVKQKLGKTYSVALDDTGRVVASAPSGGKMVRHARPRTLH